ncbi:PADI1 deiminase, partial [Ptilorrhoa leucosticta]|nr:PADI1 deiminase [Ptilorrhoa leucosticta]
RSTPRGAASFDVHATPAVTVHMIHSPTTKPTTDSRWPLDPDIEVVVTIDVTSRSVDDNQVKISYYNREGNELAVAWLYLTCVDVSLDVDVSRSGRVKSKGKDKAKWTWGPDGQGAVLLVNCDRDSPGAGGTDSGQADIRTPAGRVRSRGAPGGIPHFHALRPCPLCPPDLQDMSVMLLRTQGPSAIFAEYRVVLHVPETDADKVRVFHAVRGDSHPHYKPVLGPDKLSYVLERAGHGDSTFYVEGLAFPDRGFSGLVSFSASLLEVPHKDSPGTPIFTDTVVFRVAPWIMTPNTQQPLEVFVCSIKQGSDSNEAFLEGLRALQRKAGCRLTVCSEQDTRSDRWIQDELEFGYVEAPHKTFPVVFDSPRNRGLKDFAFKKILGPDFGYVTREPPGKSVTSLDSFGNLDVSPPVTVRGKEYPLGRILIGSPLPWASGRRMSKAVRDFLFAQQVQAPLEVYSEWLSVGHVDEFLTFVPALDRKVPAPAASPGAPKIPFSSCLSSAGIWGMELLGGGPGGWSWGGRGASQRGTGLFHPPKGPGVTAGLSPAGIPAAPGQSQRLLPALQGEAAAGPRGSHAPFGPAVGGQCCLERRVRELLEPLGLSCTFIDDFFSYHVLAGDVHCGTNVRRKPFAFKWWHVVP